MLALRSALAGLLGRGRGELKAEALGFLLIEKCRSKNGSRESKPRGGEEGGKKFSFLKSGNYLLQLQRKNLPQKGGGGKPESNHSTAPAPTGLSAGTNKQNDRCAQ